MHNNKVKIVYEKVFFGSDQVYMVIEINSQLQLCSSQPLQNTAYIHTENCRHISIEALFKGYKHRHCS
jgi:hypothetical protein